jgi:hypothetical protein
MEIGMLQMSQLVFDVTSPIQTHSKIYLSVTSFWLRLDCGFVKYE